jgi:hypothetical protein
VGNVTRVFDNLLELAKTEVNRYPAPSLRESRHAACVYRLSDSGEINDLRLVEGERRYSKKAFSGVSPLELDSQLGNVGLYEPPQFKA